MNYLELCQKVFDEADRAPYKIDTVNAPGELDEQVYKIVSWVAQAYHDVQRWSFNFGFHYREGLLFTATTGTAEYTDSTIRRVYRDSVYANRAAAPAGKWPLIYLTEEQWRDLFKTTNLSDSLPVYFVERESGRYRVEPPPSEDCEIRGAWQTRLDSLVNDEDTPIFHEDHHMVIVYQALRYYVTEYDTAEELALRIRTTLPRLKAAFMMEYEPALGVLGR